MTYAIETENLERRFRRIEAVKDLTISVPRGCVYAYVGPNGSGKTTTIKTLMNILKPSGGRASILGCDSRKLGAEQYSKIGYVSENQQLPEWMRVEEVIKYCALMYPNWDDVLCEKLVDLFSLDISRKIKVLSRGVKMKVALLCSLPYRPSLLVMDEPFGGLDPLVREDLIQAVLELADQEDWTFFISSHDIDELERMADWIGILDRGSLQLSESVASLQARFRKIEVVVQDDVQLPAVTPKDWLRLDKSTRTIHLVHSNYSKDSFGDEVRNLLPGTLQVKESGMSLKDIFITLSRSLR